MQAVCCIKKIANLPQNGASMTNVMCVRVWDTLLYPLVFCSASLLPRRLPDSSPSLEAIPEPCKGWLAGSSISCSCWWQQRQACISERLLNQPLCNDCPTSPCWPWQLAGSLLSVATGQQQWWGYKGWLGDRDDLIQCATTSGVLCNVYIGQCCQWTYATHWKAPPGVEGN